MIESGDIQVIIEDGNNANLTQQIAYIKAGKTEIEEAVQEGIGDFDTNATAKTNAFNDNASAKTLSFNQNADAKTAVYDNNASEKLSAYNENATNKLAAYNANDTAKTEAYNLNATNKTTAFNTNASEKTSTFNDNAVAKTSGFNSNATSKTNDFNSNASDKTTAFNDNYTAKKALIDAEVQTAKDWATKTDGMVNEEDYSSKAYAIGGTGTETNNSKYYSEQAGESASESKIWAEGTDGEVTPLGGTHSSKVWAQIAEDAASGVQNPANRDLSNLTNTGQMVIDSQNGTISNCILEIPQNLKLELSGNTLTAKSGSILTDSGSVYQTITLTEDKTISISNTANLKRVIFATSSGTLSQVTFSGCVSGATDSRAGEEYHIWFDTNNKNVNYYGSDGTTASHRTYPLCIVETDSNGVASFAKDSNGRDCIFNGLGFVGQTKFIYPGVKVLEPIGKNADGTLKSREYTTDSLQLATSGGTYNRRMFLNGNNFQVTNNNWHYVEDDNIYYDQNNVPFTNGCIELGDCFSVNDQVTDFTIRQPYEGARNLLTDDIEEEVATKQDKATAVNYDNITNCITEIPQDIKLELNNGTFTLKAGSKVYYPNGDTFTLTSDKTFTTSTNGVKFIQLNAVYNLEQWGVSNSYSGSTAPTASNYMQWYDTTNNTIKRTNDSGSTWYGNFSFPIAIVTVSDGAISSIDQIFNGFGYIGSTVFALPDVKGLIPNGRNADGSLKNIEFTISSVITRTATWSSEPYTITLNGGSISFVRKKRYFEQTEEPHSPNSQYDVWYNPTENYLRWDNNSISWNRISSCSSGTFVGNSGSITSLTPKTAFHALDYNDFSDLKDEVATKQVDVTTLTGYDSTQTQTLKNINGVLQWVTD